MHVLGTLVEEGGVAVEAGVPVAAHVGDDVVEVGHHGRPALLLQMLIVNEALADARDVARQTAALGGELGARDQRLVRGRHRHRQLDLRRKVDF